MMVRRDMTKAAVLAVVLFAALALPSLAAPEGKATLVFGVKVEFIDTLDPHVTAQTVSHMIMRNIFDSLIYQGPDFKFYPGLATSWSVSADGKTWTFKLRPGVRFHDGTTLTAEAVKFSFDRMVDPAIKSRMAGRLLAKYTGSRVVNLSTIQVSFSEPLASFLPAASQAFLGIVSPAGVRKWKDQFGRHPVGSGPFVFRQWVEKDRIVLARNPEYRWGPPFFARRGPSALDGIVFKIIPEDGARVAALEKGEVHVIEWLPTRDAERLQKDERFQILRVPIPGMPYVYVMNTRHPPTDELAVRRAINYAVNKEAIVKALFRGFYAPAFGPLSPATSGYDKRVEEMYRYDPEKARQLLEQASWKLGPDNVRTKNGQRLKINLYQFALYWADVAVLVQAQLKEVGFEVEVRALDVGAVNEAATKGVESNLAPLPFAANDPEILGVAFHSRNTGKGFAWSFHKIKGLDDLLDQAATTMDLGKRAQRYREIQKIIMEQALVVPIFVDTNLSGARRVVQNIRYSTRAYDPWFYDMALKR